MSEYVVEALHLTTRMVRVIADSQEDALMKVRAGGGECFDSEPGKDVHRPKWRVYRVDPGGRTPAKGADVG